MLTMKAHNTFQTDRKHLELQYTDTKYDEDTGLAVPDLIAETEAFLQKNAEMPRVLQKAHVFRIVVSRGQIALDPFDIFVDKLNHGGILKTLQRRWLSEAQQTMIPEAAELFETARETGYFHSELDLGHLSPGWSTLLQHGLRGLLGKTVTAREAHGSEITQEQTDFYAAVEIVYTSVIDYLYRYVELVDHYLERGLGAGDAHRLKRISAALKNLIDSPPDSFYEALQLSYLMHQLIEMEGEMVRSMGGFDRIYYRFYKTDIDRGVLTPESARELIKYFFIKFFAHTRGVANGKNFLFGGQLSDGRDAVNELTFLALEAYEELGVTDPKMSVRFFGGTPDLLYVRVGEIIRKGMTAFVLINDEAAVPAIVKRGKPLEDARNFLLIGCYEPAIEGKEIACNMSGRINLAKPVELVLNNGLDPLTGIHVGVETGDPAAFDTYDEFQTAYFAQLEMQIEKSMDSVRKHEELWPQINPSPLVAGTFQSCLDTGSDIGQGGAVYNNTGCMGAFLANAADSLIAVKRLVYEERRLHIEELVSVLTHNFEGHESLRQYIINRIPKWGNDNVEVDEIAKRIADFYCKKVNGVANARGGEFAASMFSLMHRYELGKKTGSLPDGRQARTYLASNLSAMTGMDGNGITAHINSITKLDFENIPNGSVLDIMLHPTAVKGEEGLSALVALIKTYFRKGGYGIQFNIFDTKALLDAQKQPEKYATLQVRVCGWNVYFVSLTADEQQQFIDSNKHMLG